MKQSDEWKKEQRERLGLRIRSLREAAGMNQVQLAELAGIQSSHISRIEAGKYAVTFETVQAIAEALGMTVDIIDPRLANLTKLKVL
ncbi:MAG: helix-turn-helix transcriptional regulator [Prevotella sp.]|nr:helix-turn-helix transcriptional regulator [Prevotella sp.]MBR3858504.1 helix-turn-helix transcriptional regulator [Bacteroidaceae bacterium]